jgi:hypothetical protein
MIRVGDVFEIPLSEGRTAYGQYIQKSKMGPIIKIFDILTTNENKSISSLTQAGSPFPPVITGLFAAIRTGMWKKVGKTPVIMEQTPQFISSLWNDKTGEVYSWSLWDGDKFTALGKDLPEKYKNYEYLVVWDPSDIVWRIETNEIPFPFGEMIKFGKFTPRIDKLEKSEQGTNLD